MQWTTTRANLTPGLDLGQVVGAFGSLSLGYGAGIVFPDVQR
jgi:hypothetical protein